MRFELPAEKKLVHEMVVPIRWGDMDAMGHVNNTIYFRYFEIVRLDWFFSRDGVGGLDGEGVIIVNAFCNFIRQFEYPGDILIRTFVSDLGRSSFDTWVTMERTDQHGVVCATGGATVVWVDFPAQKSAPLPDWLRQRLSGAQS